MSSKLSWHHLREISSCPIFGALSNYDNTCKIEIKKDCLLTTS